MRGPPQPPSTCDATGDFLDVQLHGLGVGLRQHQRRAGRADPAVAAGDETQAPQVGPTREPFSACVSGQELEPGPLLGLDHIIAQTGRFA